MPICQNLLQFAIFFQNIVCVRIENLFPTCQGNVGHRTASLPHFHNPHGGEAHSQHCAIVGRRRAVRSVAWWGDLCVARCLCAHRAWHLQIQGRLLVPTLLCGVTKGSLWAEHVLCGNLCPLNTPAKTGNGPATQAHNPLTTIIIHPPKNT